MKQDQNAVQWSGQVWVLVASMGGPEAVNNFLKVLPPDLQLAMVYGQHIEENFDGFLAEAITGQKAQVTRAKTLSGVPSAVNRAVSLDGTSKRPNE